MKNKNKIILLIALFWGLAGCEIDNTNDVQPWQESIVNTLIDKEWVRNFHASYSEKEFDVEEIWVFKKNATGSFKTITIYEDQSKEEIITYFKWSFTTAHFDIIYMDYPRFWQIKELTSEKLCVNQTYEDPIEFPEESKDYREYTVKK